MRRLALLVAVLLIGSTVTVPVASAEMCWQSHNGSCGGPDDMLHDYTDHLRGLVEKLIGIAQTVMGEALDQSCQESAYSSLPTC